MEHWIESIRCTEFCCSQPWGKRWIGLDGRRRWWHVDVIDPQHGTLCKSLITMSATGDLSRLFMMPASVVASCRRCLRVSYILHRRRMAFACACFCASWHAITWKVPWDPLYSMMIKWDSLGSIENKHQKLQTKKRITCYDSFKSINFTIFFL